MQQNPSKDDSLSADKETASPYRTWSFAIVYETERHLTVFWTTWIKSTLSQHIYLGPF
jgi:hypothetical protein